MDLEVAGSRGTCGGWVECDSEPVNRTETGIVTGIVLLIPPEESKQIRKYRQ